MVRFYWDEWNLAHIAEHGVTREEAEQVVRRAKPPFPREIGDEQLTKQSLVFVYVIHAMQLTPKMLRQFRRVERR